MADAFAGDFGSSGDRTFKDKIVKFRKEGPCSCCQEEIVPGTLGRSTTMLWEDDGVMSYRYCTPCTEAMAISGKDNGEAWEARIKL